jgi:tetratricopeptide (TPR) repeat protein
MTSVRNLQDSVVLITSGDVENRRFGTGFVIYKDNTTNTTYLLTCAHVVRDVGGAHQVVVKDYPAKVIACGSEEGPDDLAILQIEKLLNVPSLKLHSSGQKGDLFITIGFQSFDKQFLVRTIRGNLGEQVGLEIRGRKNRVRAWDLRILDDHNLQPGYSGSPVIDETSSSVLGVVSHRQGEGEKGIAISVEVLRKIWEEMPPRLRFLDENANQEALSRVAQDVLDNAIRNKNKPVRRVIGLLPQDVTSFFKNRHTEIAALRNSLTTAKLISVVGHGGTGKTALVCKVLADLEKATDIIAGLIYFTAANMQTIDLERIFSSIGKMLGCEKEMVKLYNDPQKPLVQRVEQLIYRLQRDGEVYILLLDNYEKYQDEQGYLKDKEMEIFLKKALVTSSALRIIITTRVALRLPTIVTGFSHPISLDQGLPVDCAAELLTELDPDNLGGLREVDDEVLNELAQFANGYPRALQAIASLLREDLMLTPTDLLANSELFSDNIVDGLVREALMRLDGQELQVMQALAVFGQPVPEAAITYLLQPYQERRIVKSILRRLVNSHFIIFDKTTKKLTLHPIDRAYVYQQLSTSSLDSNNFSRRSLARRAADYYEVIRLPKEYWHSFDDLQSQLSEFEQRIIAGDYDGAACLLDKIDIDYLLPWGHARKVLRMREQLSDKLKDKHLQINQYRSLGFAHKNLGSLKKAVEYFQLMLSAADKVNDKKNRVIALNELSNIFRRLTYYPKSIEYSQEALKTAREIGDQNGEGSTLGDLGKIHWCLGQYKEAIDYCQQALIIVRSINSRNLEAYTLGTLGNVHLSLKNLGKALKYYRQALEIFRELNNRQGEAYVLQDLGYTYLNLNELDKAIECSEEGLAIYSKIENQRGIGHCDFVLARIYLKKNELERAILYAEKSLFNLKETNVPEAKAAYSLVRVIQATKSGDTEGKVRALLDCAYSPANTGDLKESLDFAEEASNIAEDKGLKTLLDEAKSYIVKTKEEMSC